MINLLLIILILENIMRLTLAYWQIKTDWYTLIYGMCVVFIYLITIN